MQVSTPKPATRFIFYAHVKSRWNIMCILLKWLLLLPLFVATFDIKTATFCMVLASLSILRLFCLYWCLSVFSVLLCSVYDQAFQCHLRQRRLMSHPVWRTCLRPNDNGSVSSSPNQPAFVNADKRGKLWYLEGVVHQKTASSCQ